MTNPEAPIIVSIEDHVLTIAFNRPTKKNAINQAMYSLMHQGLETAAEDNAIRVVLFRGQENCFTSGNDIVDFLSSVEHSAELPVVKFLNSLMRFQKPIVAAVNGPAIGIGTTLLLHCDLVVAAEEAQFQLPFTSLGICPEAASSFILPLLTGHQKAAELLMFGDKFSAQEAQAIGLVNRVTSTANFLQLAKELANRLAAQPPSALRATKALLKRSNQATLEATLQVEMKVLGELLVGPEAREAMTAFMEKRAPDFSQF